MFVVLVFAGLSVGAPVRASVAWIGDVPDGMEWDPETGRLRTDILERDAAAAAEAGVADYDTRLTQLRADGAVDSVVDILSRDHADSFAGAAWEAGPVLVVRIKGEVPAAAEPLLASLPVPVLVKEAAYSLRDLEAGRDTLISSLEATGVRDWAVGIEPKSQRVFVTIGAGADEVLTQIQAESSVQLAIEVVDGPVVVPLYGFGGAELWQDFQTYRCTTGFSVVDPDTNWTGVATVDHCTLPAGSHYEDPWGYGGTIVSSATKRDQYTGTLGEFEWWTTSAAEWDDFYHDSTPTLRDVTSVKQSFVADGPVDYFGRKTEIERHSNMGWFGVSAGGVGNLICTYAYGAQEGDSGGPVYVGSSATGMISSGVSIEGALRMCFAQARHIDDTIGVYVKTS